MRPRRDGTFYDPIEDHSKIRWKSNAAFGYYFHSNFLGPFDFIDAYSTATVMWVLYAGGTVSDPPVAKRDFEEGAMVVHADYPNFVHRKLGFGGGGASLLGLAEMSCPALPRPEWVAAYEARFGAKP
jgi:hypothetical protein